MESRLLTIALALAIALAGCASDPEPTTSTPGPEPSEEGDDPSEETPEAPVNDTTDGPDIVLEATLSVDASNGTAPLPVAFTLNGTPEATWALDLGDGNTTDGDDLPATIEHTYAAGNFTATLTVEYEGETATANVTIAVTAPVVERTLPETSTWTFGPTAVCVHDLPTLVDEDPTPCIGHLTGPDPAAEIPEGRWVQMGEEYEGLYVYSTMDHGDGNGHGNDNGGWVPGGGTHPFWDSDCWFFAADGETIVGTAHNGGNGCAGLIPETAAWMYIAPYQVPAQEIIVEVMLPP